MSTQNRISPRILALRRRGTQSSSNPSTITTRTRLRASTTTSPTRRPTDTSTSTHARLRNVSTRMSVLARIPASAHTTTTASARATATAPTRTTATALARTTSATAARTSSAAVARTISTGMRASTKRTSTTSTTSDVEEKSLLPSVEASLSPFLNTTNLNARRLSLTLYVFYCPICMMNVKRENRRILATSCGHVFCDTCLVEAHSKRKVCPMCQQFTNNEDFRELFI